jgi:hypothetical protein
MKDGHTVSSRGLGTVDAAIPAHYLPTDPYDIPIHLD